MRPPNSHHLRPSPLSPPLSSRPPKRQDPSTPLPDGSYFPMHKITELAALTRSIVVHTTRSQTPSSLQHLHRIPMQCEECHSGHSHTPTLARLGRAFLASRRSAVPVGARLHYASMTSEHVTSGGDTAQRGVVAEATHRARPSRPPCLPRGAQPSAWCLFFNSSRLKPIDGTPRI